MNKDNKIIWLALCRDLNLAFYLCWNMHVRKQSAAMLAAKKPAGVAPEMNLRESRQVWIRLPEWL